VGGDAIGKVGRAVRTIARRRAPHSESNPTLNFDAKSVVVD